MPNEAVRDRRRAGLFNEKISVSHLRALIFFYLKKGILINLKKFTGKRFTNGRCVDIITVASKKFQKEVEENEFNCSLHTNSIFEYHAFDQTGMDCLSN